MGIGFVLIFWAFVGVVVCVVGGAIFGSAATFLTRGVRPSSGRVVRAASLFPVVCLGWAATIFVVQGVMNETLFDRDFGIGDTWRCPLPNGYALMMIDVTDQGWVYNPKTEGSNGIVGEREDSIPGVRLLQVSGQYILGGFDSSFPGNLGSNDSKVDSYFLLDTSRGKRTEFSTFEALRGAATQVGIQPSLETIDVIYSRFRFTWFDVVVWLLIFAPPLMGTLFLVRWIIRLRKTRTMTPEPA